MATAVTSPIQIDPQTGERIGSSAAPQIDPNTGERVDAAGFPHQQGTPKPDRLAGLKEFGGDVLEGVKGIAKGGMSTIRGLGNMEGKIPGVKSLMPADVQSFLGPEGERLTTPRNTPQAIGKGVEQAGEFMVPGAGEEKLASLAPKMLRPAAKIGASALGSGTVNALQGGEFGTGAALGAGGSAIGQGLKAVAPKIAETALGIRKADRAFGKTPGAAIINETRGIRPETIASSAQDRMGQLTPKLERAADAASVRPNPVRGLLSAPAQEIPLHETAARNPKLRPMAFNAKVNPEPPMEPRSGNSMAPISEYPGINPHYLSGSEHPGLAGRVEQPHGVLIRPQQIPIGAPPIAATVPNRMASLAPARGILGDAADKATQQNAAGLHGQIGKMQDFLNTRFSGGSIPENVTPRQLLDLKRGLSEEHLRWNPETHDRALAAGRQAYGALDRELDRTVPAAAGLNQRISSLIPVAHRAESISRGAPTLQRALGRFGAHTGALTMGGIGAAGGYKEGGVPGAIAGGLTGVLAPELAASPEGQMILARTLNKANSLKFAGGAAAQFDRKRAGQ